jgi:hypothetical protein
MEKTKLESYKSMDILHRTEKLILKNKYVCNIKAGEIIFKSIEVLGLECIL